MSLKKDAQIVTVMITKSTLMDKDAVTYADDVLYWFADDFRKWAENAIGVVRRLRQSFSGPGDLFWREKAMQEYRDSKIDPTILLNLLSKQPLAQLPIE